MFLLLLDYVKPLADVDQVTPEHRAYLERAVQAKQLVLSGPQKPRTGGVILVNLPTRAEVDKFVEEDPFHRHGVATYRVIEFELNKRDARLDWL